MNRKSWINLNHKRAIKQAERGDSGAYGSTAYMPFLFFMVVFGIFLAMLGFWRQMTVAANEKGAYTASTSLNVTAGQNETRTLFGLLTSTNGAGGAVQRSSQSSRTVQTGIQGQTTIEMPVFGRSASTVLASSQKRWEQFYAGPKDCTSATDCEE
jgi:hypothetical protein